MTNSDKLEFIGQIIDIFEDFLDEKGVKIDNPDRDRDAVGMLPAAIQTSTAVIMATFLTVSNRP